MLRIGGQNSGISQEGSAWRSQPFDVPFYSLLRMRKDIWEGMTKRCVIDRRLLKRMSGKQHLLAGSWLSVAFVVFLWEGASD